MKASCLTIDSVRKDNTNVHYQKYPAIAITIKAGCAMHALRYKITMTGLRTEQVKLLVVKSYIL